MNENKILINVPLDDYNELVRSAEKLAVLKRFFYDREYISKDDIRTILDIYDGGGDDDATI